MTQAGRSAHRARDAAAGISKGHAHGQESRIAPLVLGLPERASCPERGADDIELEALPFLEGEHKIDLLAEEAVLSGERHLEAGIAKGGCGLDQPVAVVDEVERAGSASMPCACARAHPCTCTCRMAMAARVVVGPGNLMRR